MKSHLEINGRKIGPGCPVYLVAEISANHSQKFDQAVAIIEAAAGAGADAIKLQTYTPDTLTIRSDEPCFKISGGTLWDGKTLHDLYGEAYTPWEWQPKLKKIANDLKMDLFSSPFDATAVDFLNQMGVPAHKIASFEAVDLALIEKAARSGKPLIISTGMATLEEVGDAVEAAKRGGADQIALLKCTSAYPASPEEMNLKAIELLANTFKVPVGISDHTMGIEVSVAAVALGACIIERHVTLSRKMESADSSFSLEPQEFKALHDAVRNVEKALGQPRLNVSYQEQKSRIFRRSLFAVEDIKAGETLTGKNVRSIRPANGLKPKHLSEILGRKAKNPIKRGTPLQWDLLH